MVLQGYQHCNEAGVQDEVFLLPPQTSAPSSALCPQCSSAVHARHCRCSPGQEVLLPFHAAGAQGARAARGGERARLESSVRQ